MARFYSFGLALLAGLASLPEPMHAQTCSGTQDFSGPYVFTAVRLAYVPQSATPPATTVNPPLFIPQATAPPGTTGQYSLTPIGQLVGWASSTSPFSGVGRVLADGAGVIYANRGDDPTFVRVGVYAVSNDCSISLAFNDGFTTRGAPLPGVGFQGVLTDRGNEASLVQGTLGSGVLLNFRRPLLASGCSAASLGGRYGLSGIGAEVGDARATSPLTFALQFVADGGGGIVSPASVSGATGYSGSYTVKSDCTGSLTLTSQDKTTRKYAFVLTGSNTQAGQLPRATIQLVLDDAGKVAGLAEAH